MAALVAGVQYGLSSQLNLNENKSIIFVKLTDSALKAIEDYVKNRNKCIDKPTIQFNGHSEGQLSFPSGQNARAGFNFNLLSNEDIEGPQGSFETPGSSHLESVGALHRKMQIKAKEDIYEATRQRMASEQLKLNKSCAREIELVSGRKQSKHTKVVAPAPRPDITKRPLRDRIIHLLAVRPYKKPELYAALTRDGIRDRDRNQMMAILNGIAFARDNTYHLQRHVWNDVQDDWPFYSQQDKNMLKRRKPANLTPPGSSDTGSTSSSGASPESPPPTLSKRPKPGYFEGADGFQTKRLRVSHYRKPAPGGPTPLPVGANPSHCSPPPEDRDTPPMTPPPPQPPAYTPPPAPLINHSHTPPRPTSVPNLTNTTTTTTTTTSTSNSTSTFLPKYEKDYTTIVDLEQRRRYKNDFSESYKEYQMLHAKIETVASRFASLQNQLRRETPGSFAHKQIQDTIVREYHENKTDRKFEDCRRRFEYLHNKLSHIKKLVFIYDSNNLK
ncbi:hypothetical protein M8J76_003820 [Diaphorina citri]|nr:hypothetical protein M8J76_003820 [Diaphorina citri]